jgi:acetyl esterase/lipase
VILLVHGGGWWRGSPAIVSHAADYTRRRSDLFKPVAVRYSLHSVARAFRDLASSARYWRLRGCRVFAYGESNGANMVENLASRGLVSAAAAVSPPTDLLSWSYRAHSYRTYGRDLSTPAGRAYAENSSSAPMSWAYLDATPSVLRRMSPSLHPYDARRQAPLLIFQSCDDTVVRCAMNLRYARSDGGGARRPSNRIRYRPVHGDHATPAVKAASFRVSYRWFRYLVRRR